MTENDTIKALGCGKSIECKDCPYRDVEMCLDKVCEDALSIINRQKEDIEHYKKAFFNSQNIFSDQALENECMKAEIDSIKEKLKLYSYYKEPFVKHIKSEAIKEFAEKLKEAPIKMGIPLLGLQTKSEIEEYFNGILLQFRDAIDDLVKEMTEDEK